MSHDVTKHGQDIPFPTGTRKLPAAALGNGEPASGGTQAKLCGGGAGRRHVGARGPVAGLARHRGGTRARTNGYERAGAAKQDASVPEQQDASLGDATASARRSCDRRRRSVQGC
jgi:hypothetical protein